MNLYLPSDLLSPPAPLPLSGARVPPDPSQTTGYPAALEFVRNTILRCHGVLGNAWLGGLNVLPDTSAYRVLVYPGVVQLVLPDDGSGLTGTRGAFRCEKTQTAYVDIPNEGLLVLAYNGRVSGGELSVNSGNSAKLDIAAGVYRINGVEVIGAPASAVTIGSGATTSSSQFRMVVVTIDGSGTYGFQYGTAVTNLVQGYARPPLPPDVAEVGTVTVPKSWTADSSPVGALGLQQQPTTDPTSLYLIPLDELTEPRLRYAVPLAACYRLGGVVIARDARRPTPLRPRVVMGSQGTYLKNGTQEELVPVDVQGVVLMPGEALLITATACILPKRVGEYGGVMVSNVEMGPSLTNPSNVNAIGSKGFSLTLYSTVSHWGALRGVDKNNALAPETWGTSLWPIMGSRLFLPPTTPAFYDINGLWIYSLYANDAGANVAMNVFYPTIALEIVPARLAQNPTVPWWKEQGTARSFTPQTVSVATPETA